MMHVQKQIFLTIGIILYFIQNVKMHNSISCPDHLCRCIINNYDDDYIMECPPVHSVIALKLSLPKNIEIECNSNDENVYDHIPQLNIGEIRTIHMTRCPIPENDSIISKLNKLNITKVKALFFKNRIANGFSKLQRKHLKNLDGLERLSLSENGLTELPIDLFDDIQNLNWLDLQQNNISLHKGIFSKLGNLTFLELAHNNLESIDNGLFENQNQLEVLNLWGNNITNISGEWFNGLESLKLLDLSKNSIQSLNSKILEYLPNLKVLSLNMNPIDELTSDIFSYNKNIKKIRLAQNKVNLTIPDRMFANLENLEEVFINDAKVLSFGTNMFDGCTKLERITISNNLFEILPITTFLGAINLQTLDLSNNHLTSLEDLFNSLTKLTTLNLSHNNVENVTK